MRRCAVGLERQRLEEAIPGFLKPAEPLKHVSQVVMGPRGTGIEPDRFAIVSGRGIQLSPLQKCKGQIGVDTGNVGPQSSGLATTLDGPVKVAQRPVRFT